MAVEILDGTIDPAEPVRAKAKYGMFSALRFRDRNGGERTLSKVCTGGELTALVRKGGTGRFYLSSGGGQTGIHGVRLDDGTSAYAHYNNMELIVMIGIAAGAAMLVIGVVTGDILWLPVVIGVLLLGAYFFLRGIRVAGKRQYDADARV
ncbi:MAG TPA: hypothetical protein VLA02_08910 [Reyranella sp.]|nr:hypothetical protein [Reyranella sp.]